MLPSVVEYLYVELDGISDLMSPVQPSLLTKAVTDDDQCKRKSNQIKGINSSNCHFVKR